MRDRLHDETGLVGKITTPLLDDRAYGEIAVAEGVSEGAAVRWRCGCPRSAIASAASRCTTPTGMRYSGPFGPSTSAACSLPALMRFRIVWGWTPTAWAASAIVYVSSAAPPAVSTCAAAATGRSISTSGAEPRRGARSPFSATAGSAPRSATRTAD